VTTKQLKKQKGWAFLSYQYPCLREALRDVYPETNWRKDKFIERQRVPLTYWGDGATIERELRIAERRLGIRAV
jgi:hypothetical protein